MSRDQGRLGGLDPALLTGQIGRLNQAIGLMMRAGEACTSSSATASTIRPASL